MSESVTLPAGLTKTILRPGHGPPVRTNDKVTVHCVGMLEADRKKFWSTKDPGQQPFTFNVGIGQVIPGWDQGCLSMTVGEEAELHIASALGYGNSGFPSWGIPPNANLIFRIEILSATKS
ncbi:PREDICTED: peptidyl-prolyl cis-trans isomerase FKBP12-like [Amphimedon queenslandica]|uniref:peptidylprolyl isomerase n=1 Tax=Amphimedon queenslandica TaxID=400682 RepID=A0A1X7VND6_AMPQE|nr:PREDICTED: peptidyl-prolyl cis-trans isomerase FKBP12-like [Amphimedon queenslandica]|eukprot:XP_003383441.1 PREDICTED: peptidyl-prolyl cis-trans isomerase FKBP12-like [Amphimedon queenslandica]